MKMIQIFKENYIKLKYNNKKSLLKLYIGKMEYRVDPNSIFDVQVKRLHAYKRQVLNCLK